MTKTLAAARRQERVKFKVPRSVQDAIPIRRIWPDGIFQVGNQYSKSWSFTDINYAIAGKDDKMAMFLDYCALLNSLDSGASAKITIHNRRIDKEDFERSVLLPLRGDSLDPLAHARQPKPLKHEVITELRHNAPSSFSINSRTVPASGSIAAMRAIRFA